MSTAAPPRPRRILPREPRSWEEAGLDPVMIEQIILRYLLVTPSSNARDVAVAIACNAQLVKDLMESMRQNKVLVARGTTGLGDLVYELTEAGRTKAMDSRRVTMYVGPAPVPYDHYLKSVRAQSITVRAPGPEDLTEAMSDLVVDKSVIRRLGPAVAGGKALFLFGEPGNGKTSFAERLTKCFGDLIWIPRTLMIDGHLIKLFDAASHTEVEPQLGPNEKYDERWVQIKRPTIVAGGELTLDMLDIQADAIANVAEPPLQLKANCGTLVIDDFGRGRTSPKELLNRWIFPLEKRVDFLKLPDGRKIQAPFDCLLVFSTNLQPHDLADEAFLRRIPYKIRVDDPTEAQFREVLAQLAAKHNVQVPPGSFDHLIQKHYKAVGRPFRFCHPRDLTLQIVNLAAFERRQPVANPEDWDQAVDTYFGAG